MYFLVDRIYPAWAIFAKTIVLPINIREAQLSKRHEHVRKDIERCFGVLVQKYGILQRPFKGWDIKDIRMVVNCCIIIHNMTIENRRNNFRFTDLHEWDEDVVIDEEMDGDVESIFMEENNQVDIGIATLLARRVAHMSSSVEDQEKHVELQDDIIEHIAINY